MSAARGEGTPVGEHYGRGDLAARILEALRAAGKNPDDLTVEDLAPVDQFHTRGREATLELARVAGVKAGMKVLDVGGGLGGPARTLASEFGCTVEVLDLTEEFCQAGEMLTARTRLSDLVSFRHGNALEMPYPDASFDLVWTQHEIMAGPTSPIHFPVPWARDPSISHLQPPNTIRSLIATTGFNKVEWVDETASATGWFHQRLSAMASEGPPPLGLHLLLGPDFGEMFRNQVLNLSEGRISVIQAVFVRA